MPRRTTLNVSLPPMLKQWLDREAQRGGFETTSEFVRHLIREARLTKAGPDSASVWTRADLERALSAGQRGVARELTDEAWTQIRARGLAKANARSAAGPAPSQGRARRKSA
jgi:antitoxin ParD1/3/4